MATNRQQASVELSVILHGPAAILGPSPPGPDQCPATCSWCNQTEVAEGVG